MSENINNNLDLGEKIFIFYFPIINLFSFSFKNEKSKKK